MSVHGLHGAHDDDACSSSRNTDHLTRAKSLGVSPRMLGNAASSAVRANETLRGFRERTVEVLERALTKRNPTGLAASINVARTLVVRWLDKRFVDRRPAPLAWLLAMDDEAFRESMLQRYQGRCVVTGCAVASALDAAHLLPFAVGQLDAPSNGLLLRTDLHRLFDRDLIGIDANLRVHVHPSIAGCGYDDLHGVTLALAQPPSPVGIRFRWDAFVRSLPASIARAS